MNLKQLIQTLLLTSSILPTNTTSSTSTTTATPKKPLPPLSKTCQNHLTQLQQYSTLSSLLQQDIRAQKALLPILEHKARTCHPVTRSTHQSNKQARNEEPTNSHSTKPSPGDNLATDTNTDTDICLAYKSAHENHIYRLAFSVRQREHLLRGQRKVMRERSERCTREDEEVLRWRKAMGRHERAVKGVSKSAEGVGDWVRVLKGKMDEEVEGVRKGGEDGENR